MKFPVGSKVRVVLKSAECYDKVGVVTDVVEADIGKDPGYNMYKVEFIVGSEYIGNWIFEDSLMLADAGKRTRKVKVKKGE